MKRASFWILSSLICLFGSSFFSCSKNKYTTKPQITLKSINTQIPANGSLEALLGYTSKKGNLGGGHFIAIRTRLNQDPVSPTGGNTDTFSGPIPAFPDQQKAEFKFTADYQSLYETGSVDSVNTEIDTIIFRFAAIDADNNSSDTITSPKIMIQPQ